MIEYGNLDIIKEQLTNNVIHDNEEESFTMPKKTTTTTTTQTTTTTATGNSGSDRRSVTQVFVLKTDKRIFEALDSLNENPKFSKIKLNLVNHEQKPVVMVSHNMDPDAAKVVALDILNGTFQGYTEYKGSASSKRADGKPEARVLKITKNDPAKYRIPYSVTVEVGAGEVIGQGAVKMVQKEQSVTVFLSEFDMKRFAVSVLDYIRAWEAARISARLNAAAHADAPAADAGDADQAQGA